MTTTHLASAADWTPPGDLGAVRLIARIGRGASGIVYRGYDQVLGRPVAVKFLTGLAGSAPERRQRFLDEARAAAAVRHPNLVQIHQAATAEATPYLVLEYVPGVTLSLLLERCGPLTTAGVMAVLADTSSALSALHTAGILHRDIKPGNLMLDREAHARVTDLGLALHQPSQMAGSVQAALAGTPAYMAPEVFEGRASVRGDVYALGMTVFALLAGAPPFDGTPAQLYLKHQNDALPSDRLLALGISAAIVEVIERAIHKQAVFRYKSVADFTRAYGQTLGKTDLERARRELSLLVARCSGPPEPSEQVHEASPAANYAGTLDQILQAKRRRQGTEGHEGGAASRSDADPAALELPPISSEIGSSHELTTSPSEPRAAPAGAQPPDAESHPAEESQGLLPKLQFLGRKRKSRLMRQVFPSRHSQLALGLMIGALAFAGGIVAAGLTRHVAPKLTGIARLIVFAAVYVVIVAAALGIFAHYVTKRLKPRLLSELRRRGLCHECGYDLSGNTSGVCPECGAAVEPPGATR